MAISVDGTWGPRATSARGVVAATWAVLGFVAECGEVVEPGVLVVVLPVGAGLGLSLQPADISARTRMDGHPAVTRQRHFHDKGAVIGLSCGVKVVDGRLW